MVELVVPFLDCRLSADADRDRQNSLLCSVAGGVAAQSQLILQRSAGRGFGSFGDRVDLEDWWIELRTAVDGLAATATAKACRSIRLDRGRWGVRRQDGVGNGRR
jgi:hypothetical protein